MRSRHLFLVCTLLTLLGAMTSCATHNSTPPFESTTSLRLILYG